LVKLFVAVVMNINSFAKNFISEIKMTRISDILSNNCTKLGNI
jgi:hypothetical protein